MDDLDSFSYDDDSHTYFNAAGLVRPSATETLKHGGIYDFSRVRPEVLERKREIGKNVHRWTAAHDLSGREDDNLFDLYEEERPYAEAYLRWRDQMGETVKMLEIEKSMVREIGGVQLGGTPDRFCRIGERLYMVELKCVDSMHPGWRLQLADYCMMHAGRPNCNVYGRAVLRLRKNGKPIFTVIPPTFDAQDSAVATALAQTYVWRKNHNLL